MRNFCLTLCYDGTRYRGWQRQGNTGATIQGKVEAVLSRALAQPVETAASGRTDAGVHAREQVVSFRGHTELSCEEILQALRDYLPEDIGATALAEAPPRFHARLSCREKTYLYRVWNSPAPCVFQRRYVCRWPEPLDTAAMEAAGRGCAESTILPRSAPPRGRNDPPCEPSGDPHPPAGGGAAPVFYRGRFSL